VRFRDDSKATGASMRRYCAGGKKRESPKTKEETRGKKKKKDREAQRWPATRSREKGGRHPVLARGREEGGKDGGDIP